MKDNDGNPIVDANITVDNANAGMTDANGELKVSTKNLNAGTYDFNITFKGNENYGKANTALTIVINKAASHLSADNITTHYNSSEKFTATLTDITGTPISNANLTIYLDNIKNDITDNNGKITLPLKGIDPDDYIAVVMFDGNENYLPSTSYTEVIINKLNTTVQADNFTFEEGVVLEVTVDPNASGLIEFSIEGPVSYVEYSSISKGVAKSQKFSARGRYTVTVTYLGNDYYNINSTAISFNVPTNKQDTYINSTVAIVDDNVTITVNVYPNATGSVMFEMDNYNISVPVNDGKAVFNDIFQPGNYMVSATYLGDYDFNANSTNITFAVNKFATKIIASKVSTTYGTGKNIIITLTDARGNLLIGKTVSIKLNGKNYNIVTNHNGQVSVAVPKNLAPKKYAAEISFEGDNIYLKSTKSVQVVVAKAKSKITAKKNTKYKSKKKIKKYKITLKSGKKPIKKVKVTITIKGKKYKKTFKAKTNKKGKAIFKIKKLTKKGKYTATIKFKGNKYYKAVSKKVKIKVK